ncbi:hypothetical protein LSAT2_016114 [Lamellibrachia satsuma]|nr:hypothetical protein LSAT2_016114 [Lamellibrachia satsuma]
MKDLQGDVKLLQRTINEKTRLASDQQRKQGGQDQHKGKPKKVRSAELIETLRAAAQPVKGESEDDRKRRTLDVIHLLREHGEPELWRQVAGQLGVSDDLNLSHVMTKYNLVDIEYLMASGGTPNVTSLKVEAVQRLCRGLSWMGQLKRLDLWDTGLTDAGFTRVCQTVMSCRQLTLFNCGLNEVTDDVRDIVRQIMRDLSGLTIDLYGCRLSPDVCAQLGKNFGGRIDVDTSAHGPTEREHALVCCITEGVGETSPPLVNRPSLGETRPPLVHRPSQGETSPPLVNRPSRGETSPPLVHRPSQGETSPPLVNRPFRGETNPSLVNRPSTNETSPSLVNRPSTNETSPPLVNRPFRGKISPPLVNRSSRGKNSPTLVNRPSQGETSTPLVNRPSRGETT